jgi:hypothetical protein
MASQYPDPRNGTFVDPRPTLTEAWLLAMIELMKSKIGDEVIQSLLVDSCVAVVSILFYKTMGKTANERMKDPGMDLDGPQSLAITTFLEHFFRVDSAALQAAGEKLLETVPVDTQSLQNCSGDRNLWGVAIIGASLLRASAGALPPWTIESVPDIYSSLFGALGKDTNTFGLMLRLSMEIRLLNSESFGGVPPGRVLAGRVFEIMSQEGKDAFAKEARRLCREDCATSWRKLKVLTKQVCGGKKKETDFNQRPPYTQWDFDRI